MKRQPSPAPKQPLVLKRDVVKVLDDDVLRQTLGGAKGGSSNRMMLKNSVA